MNGFIMGLILCLCVMSALIIRWYFHIKMLRTLIVKCQEEVIEKNILLQETEALYNSFLSASPFAILVLSLDGSIIEASPKSYQLFQMETSEKLLIGCYLQDFIESTNMIGFQAMLFQLGNGDEVEAGVFTSKSHDNKEFILEVTGELVLDNEGNPSEIVTILRDITRERELEEELINNELHLHGLTEELRRQNKILSEKATIDRLTGIHNRYYFDLSIDEHITRAEKYATPISLIMFDLDKFKYVNDTYGHEVGDQVLIRISKTVQDMMQNEDVFVRWGGEEFVVLLPQCIGENATKLAEKIRKEVEAINHPQVGTVTISIGVTEYCRGEEAKEWFVRTDRELYHAKHQGCNQVSFGVKKTRPSLIEIRWDESLVSGYKPIDDQHKELIQLGNELISSTLLENNNLQIREKLSHLLNHIKFHFAEEEKILEQIQYRDVTSHVKAHKCLLKKAELLLYQVENEEISPTVAFEFIVNDVILLHLKKDDVRFFEFVADII